MNTAADGSAQLGVGCARLGEATSGVSWRRSVGILRDAADGAVTWFDTADAYTSGTSERLIGAAFHRRRSEVTIATKAGYLFRPRSLPEARARYLAGPVLRRLGRRAVDSATGDEGKFAAQDFSPDALRTALDASLRRLRTDYVDLFQLHAPRGVDVTAIMTLVDELVGSGKIRRFGIGVEDLAETEPWLGVAGVDSIQLPFSILDRSATAIIARAQEHGTSVVARSVLGGGALARGTVDQERTAGLQRALRELADRRGVTLIQLAIAYAASRPGVDVVLVGVRTSAQLRDLLGARSFCVPAPELVGELEELVAGHERALDQ